MWGNYVEVGTLLGQTLVFVERGNDEITFRTADSTYKMFHYQDCCESVYIEDICGDLNDLVGTPLTMAEEVASDKTEPLDGDYSYTWTFYKFATVKGYVTIRWYGSSNGYYSESVSFEQVD